MKVKQEASTGRTTTTFRFIVPKMLEIRMQVKPCIQDSRMIGRGNKMFSEHAKYLKPHD